MPWVWLAAHLGCSWPRRIPEGMRYFSRLCRCAGENGQAIEIAGGLGFPKMVASPGKSLARHGSREMLQIYEGGCHCGRVRFRIRVDLEQSTVGECNCSICTKKGILHISVTP